MRLLRGVISNKSNELNKFEKLEGGGDTQGLVLTGVR